MIKKDVMMIKKDDHLGLGVVLECTDHQGGCVFLDQETTKKTDDDTKKRKHDECLGVDGEDEGEKQKRRKKASSNTTKNHHHHGMSLVPDLLMMFRQKIKALGGSNVGMVIQEMSLPDICQFKSQSSLHTHQSNSIRFPHIGRDSNVELRLMQSEQQ